MQNGIEPVSLIPFRRRLSRAPVAALDHARILASSGGLGWQGVHLEIAANRGWNVDDLMLDGHFVAINIGDQEMRFEALVDGAWIAARMPPGTFWINPEGVPFSVRSDTFNRWAGAVIDGKFLDSVLGRHYELRGGFAIVDDLVSHLMRALVIELENGGRTGSMVARHLIHTFVATVALRLGVPAAELPAKGGLTAHQLQLLLMWLKTDLARPITVAAMAEHVRLSPAHFSREFKRTTGNTPWGYVLQLRLEQACKLLDSGDAIGDIAAECGFGDQAHLCRVFKHKMGISPSAYARDSRRRSASMTPSPTISPPLSPSTNCS